MKKKILTFPYHPDIDFLIEYSSMMKDSTLIGAASYREDNVLTRELNERLENSDNFEKMLEECDQLLLLENYRGCRVEKYYEVMEKAIAANKEILLVPQLEKELELDRFKGCYTLLQSFPGTVDMAQEEEMLTERKKYVLEVPVIAVFGMGKHCHKFENQIRLKKLLDKEGYSSVWISSNPLGILFGGVSMPAFLFDEHLSFEIKVMRFHKFIYELSIDKKPDVFVIGVPEGISEFEKYEFHHFAEYALVIGSAVSVDSSILCTYYFERPVYEGIEQMILHSREKFAFPVNTVCIGRTGYEMRDEIIGIQYLFSEKEFAAKNYTRTSMLPDTVVEGWEEEKVETAMKQILAQLQGNMFAI